MVHSQDVSIEVEGRGEEACVIRASGEFDMRNADVLRRTFDDVIEQGARNVVVDLGHVSFIDSSGLRCIVRAALALQELGGSLQLENTTGAVARILEITGVIEQLRQHPPASAPSG